MAAHRRRPILNFDNTRKARDYSRKLVDPLNHYSEEQLRSRYRFGRECINFIVELLSQENAPSTKRSQSLSATEQVLVTLRFLASGSFLEVIGDTFLSYDKSTVSRVVRRVTLALASKVNDILLSFQQHQMSETKSSMVSFALEVSLVRLAIFYPNDNSVLLSQHCASKPGA